MYIYMYVMHVYINQFFVTNMANSARLDIRHNS